LKTIVPLLLVACAIGAYADADADAEAPDVVVDDEEEGGEDAAPAATTEDEDEGGIKVTVLSKPDECTQVVDMDDAVYIMHEGFAVTDDGETKIDANPPKSETDPTLEPLKVYIGKGHVLAGMDLALRDRCLGEEIDVMIPPELAFDDPSKDFGEGKDNQGKPVPDGTFVRYKMKVVKIDKGAANFEEVKANKKAAREAREQARKAKKENAEFMALATNVALALLVVVAGYVAFLKITTKKAPKAKVQKRAPKAAKQASKKSN